MKILLTISFTLLTSFCFGQGKANRELTQFLKSNKVDTFIIIKSGCSSCNISYENIDRVKNADTVTVRLVYQKKGKQTLMIFSDTGLAKNVTYSGTEIFKIIANNREILRTKDAYYQEQKLAKFHAPRLVSFPYETIQLKYGQFTYRHTLVERETDDCGTVLTNEDWFKVEIEILKMIDKLKT